MSQRRGNAKKNVVANSPKTQSPQTAPTEKKIVYSPVQRKQEPTYQFGDTSDENVKIEEELKSLDAILQREGLERKKIPKDGACLFRAIAEQLFYTQETHFQVRQQCVDFIAKHKDDYEPFICVSGMPWDHYLFEMRKEKSWGGQVELQALSLLHSVNFVIYSPNSSDTTKVDNGFSRSILLCYYGNHYDCVYPSKHLFLEKSLQSLVYQLVDTSLGLPVKDTYEYKNVGWSVWVKQLVEQQKKDEIMAHSLSDRNEVADYTNLSGYYNKKEQENWNVKIKNSPKKKENHNKKTMLKINAPNEDKDLKDALKQISMMERRERKDDKPKEEFPSLPPTVKMPVPVKENIVVPAETAEKTESEVKEEEEATVATEEKPATEATDATEAKTETEVKPPAKPAWGVSKNWKEVFVAKPEEEKEKKEENSETTNTENHAEIVEKAAAPPQTVSATPPQIAKTVTPPPTTGKAVTTNNTPPQKATNTKATTPPPQTVKAATTTPPVKVQAPVKESVAPVKATTTTASKSDVKTQNVKPATTTTTTVIAEAKSQVETKTNVAEPKPEVKNETSVTPKPETKPPAKPAWGATKNWKEVFVAKPDETMQTTSEKPNQEQQINIQQQQQKQEQQQQQYNSNTLPHNYIPPPHLIPTHFLPPQFLPPNNNGQFLPNGQYLPPNNNGHFPPHYLPPHFLPPNQFPNGQFLPPPNGQFLPPSNGQEMYFGTLPVHPPVYYPPYFFPPNQ